MAARDASSVRAEVWRAVEALNATWTQGDAGALAPWFDPEMVAVTPSDPEPLVGRQACLASWQRFVARAQVRRWTTRAPVVRVHGDTAVVAYRYTLDAEVEGRVARFSGRDLMVLRRVAGRWRVVADHFSEPPAPTPPTPASPLRVGDVGVGEIAAAWAERWGGAPIVTPWGHHAPDAVRALALRARDDRLAALACWVRRATRAELVTLDAWPTGCGHGGRLLAHLHAQLRAAGVRCIRCATTNDNVRALAFYQRHGYRLVGIHLDGVDAVRRHKAVPPTGPSGLPIRDVWELVCDLAAPQAPPA